MAIKIIDDCINFEACESEYPNNAIYVLEANWRFSDGTTMTNDTDNQYLSDDFFILLQINVQNVKVLMKNQLVLQYVLLTVVYLTKIM